MRAAVVPVLRLKRGEDRRLRAGHLWVFSNEVDNDATPLTHLPVGAMVRVLSDRDQFLGYAYVNPHALICARILSRSPVHPPDRSLLVHRLKVALALRERLYTAPYYRWVFGESDGLPGLVLDRYGEIVVGQIATAGMEALRSEIEAAVVAVLDPRVLVWKNDGALYSSLDADSEGHEGRFYLWQRESVQEALAPQEWAVFAARFGMDAAPNFEGQWHLRVSASLESIAATQRLSLEQVRAVLDSSREKLLRLRAARVRPGLD